MSIYTNSNLAISIYAERTPNPRVMKFVSNKKLVNNPHEFKAKVDASNCPIASALFMHEFISEIYIDFNFISVSLKLGYDWENHIMDIREFILSYIKDGNTIINQGYDIEKKFDSISLNELDETSKEIAKLIDEQIKPAVAQDGGNIVFQSFDKKSGEVKVLSQGMSEEEAKKNKKSFEEKAKTRIKTGLILNEFGEKNQIKVTEQEVQAEVQKQLRMMPGQEKMVMDFYQKNPSALASLRGTV